MSKNLFLFLAIFLSIFLAYPQGVHAKKTLPRQGSAKASVGAKTGGSKGVNVSVKFKADRKGIVASFGNLEIASSVSYSLSYTQRGGIREGAGGTVGNLSEGSVTRELLFATCSSGVCRYHTGIKNAKFTVTTTLKNGKKVVKNFRLKV